MTTGDYVSIGILALFVVLGVAGAFRWVVRAVLGLAVGCAVLIALSYSASVPAVGQAGELLGDGQITPALRSHADGLLARLRPAAEADQPPDHSAQADSKARAIEQALSRELVLDPEDH